MEKHKKHDYNNNEFKISVPTGNEKSELPDGLYSVSVIQYYFNHIIKKHEALTDPPIRKYVN